jgi:hypothetical protein
LNWEDIIKLILITGFVPCVKMELRMNIILCSSLNNIRNKMFSNILSIFLSFHVLTDEEKFLYLFQCEEYDIVEIIVRGVNEMYNRTNELIDKYLFF